MGGRLPSESVVAFALESLVAFARKTQGRGTEGFEGHTRVIRSNPCSL